MEAPQETVSSLKARWEKQIEEKAVKPNPMFLKRNSIATFRPNSINFGRNFRVESGENKLLNSQSMDSKEEWTPRVNPRSEKNEKDDSNNGLVNSKEEKQEENTEIEGLREAIRSLHSKCEQLMEENQRLEEIVKHDKDHYSQERQSTEEKIGKFHKEIQSLREKITRLEIANKEQHQHHIKEKERMDQFHFRELARYGQEVTRLSLDNKRLEERLQIKSSRIHTTSSVATLPKLLGRNLEELDMRELKETEAQLHAMLVKIGEAKLYLVQLQNEKERKQTEQIKLKMDQLEQSRLCKICEENEMEIVLIPCGHVCLCKSCSVRLNVCPICRVGVKQKLKIYQS